MSLLKDNDDDPLTNNGASMDNLEKQILEALLTEDQRDIALRAFSNCMRFILK